MWVLVYLSIKLSGSYLRKVVLEGVLENDENALLSHVIYYPLRQ